MVRAIRRDRLCAGALSNGRPYRYDETGRLTTLTSYLWITRAIDQVSK